MKSNKLNLEKTGWKELNWEWLFNIMNSNKKRNLDMTLIQDGCKFEYIGWIKPLGCLTVFQILCNNNSVLIMKSKDKQ